MSYKLVEKAFEKANVGNDRTALLVLVAMCSKGGDDGRIFPAVSTVAQMTRMSTRQVRRVIDRLETYGVLVKFADARHHQPTEYRLRVDIATSGLRDDTAMSGLDPIRGDISERRGDIATSVRDDIQMSTNREEREIERDSSGDVEPTEKELRTIAQEWVAVRSNVRNPNGLVSKILSEDRDLLIAEWRKRGSFGLLRTWFALIGDCIRCDAYGWIVDGHGDPVEPTVRCTHLSPEEWEAATRALEEWSFKGAGNVS